MTEKRTFRQSKNDRFRPVSNTPLHKFKKKTESNNHFAFPINPIPLENNSSVYFSKCIHDALKDVVPDFNFEQTGIDSLSSLPYEQEFNAKQLAIKKFWQLNNLSGTPRQLIPAAEPRRYRATSKRRIVITGKKISLLTMQHRCAPATLHLSNLEPELHEKIYRYLHATLNTPPNFSLASSLNYCIVRGYARNVAIIFNINEINANVVRRARIIAENLRIEFPEVSSASIYVDPSRSDYYLESRRPEHGIGFKKIFGSEFMDIIVNDIKLLYPPTVFSQSNEAMLPVFLRTLNELVTDGSSSRLLDLYCGYGLIGLHLFPRVSALVGMEIEGPAVNAAINNARHLFPDKSCRFITGAITLENIQSKLPPVNMPEIVIADPPRQGTAQGVITTIAERCPVQVIHIFCGTDKISEETREWERNGYKVKTIIPFDMFPGSPNLETVVVLKPEK